MFLHSHSETWVDGAVSILYIAIHTEERDILAPALQPLSNTCLFYLYFISQRKSRSCREVRQGIIFLHEEALKEQKLEYLVKSNIIYNSNELYFIHVNFFHEPLFLFQNMCLAKSKNFSILKKSIKFPID